MIKQSVAWLPISERGRLFGGICHSACLILLEGLLLGLLLEPDDEAVSTSEEWDCPRNTRCHKPQTKVSYLTPPPSGVRMSPLGAVGPE
jgi:hypothetical protein